MHRVNSGCNTSQIILRLVPLRIVGLSRGLLGLYWAAVLTATEVFTGNLNSWVDVGGAIDPVTSMAFQGRLAVAKWNQA